MGREKGAMNKAKKFGKHCYIRRGSCNTRTEYLNAHGQYHNIKDPAIVWDDGERQWRINGLLHREDGPACIMANGTQYWYLDGCHYGQDDYNREMAKRKAKQ